MGRVVTERCLESGSRANCHRSRIMVSVTLDGVFEEPRKGVLCLARNISLLLLILIIEKSPINIFRTKVSLDCSYNWDVIK
jgi:hypothetical protein